MATTPNSTSGTYGTVVIDVVTVIEHAVRRCGVSASVVSAEQLASARDNLFLVLSNLVNRGLSLWCIQRETFGLVAGLAEYELPVGTVDLLRAFLRSGTSTAATTTGAGAASVALASAAAVGTTLVTPAVAGTYTLVLEASTDDATWVEAGSATVEYTGAYPVGVDARRSLEYTYWRVRDTTDPTRVLSAATFVTAMRDLEITKQSRDDYSQIPDKMTVGERPVQYWYDKQFYRPRMVLWPAPSVVNAVHIFKQTQIQDPGGYTNALQIPQRWQDAVIAQLAPRVCLELPAEMVPPGRYELLVGVADATLRAAEDSEVDGAPIRISPNLTPYTS